MSRIASNSFLIPHTSLLFSREKTTLQAALLFFFILVLLPGSVMPCGEGSVSVCLRESVGIDTCAAFNWPCLWFLGAFMATAVILGIRGRIALFTFFLILICAAFLLPSFSHAIVNLRSERVRMSFANGELSIVRASFYLWVLAICISGVCRVRRRNRASRLQSGSKTWES